MSAKPDARTINMVHYPGGDETDPQELGAYLDTIEANITQISTDLASTANGDGASLIGIEDSGGLITATTVEGALAENRAAIDALEASAAAKLQNFFTSVLILTPEDQDYKIVVKSPIQFTIQSITTISTTGTCTLTGKINTTALGGTANSVSTTEQEQTHSSSNVVGVGDDVVLTVSSNSAAENVSVTLKCLVNLFGL